ncbi:ABC-type nitrate/sulfonate/bicarbonate transport system permease component [Branchiibius hedensis]|uniref:ABC-type nitrate/sulfonate/bicarbonate transport system, permease component n=1 Tax=Branchiibius hedensis TaxID=672460 RepID=A0A2Y8ZZH1_9MICO|nr:ABC transporter permease [Branchiibius hedensis]PWJ26838.1 ABC-type nitrate/sulfonate/bicarbonate transport system permease component [Branchiibius hedensis]SSA35649.1 ABC-type nitrate/sulfonate/bicarbonate transport system, permease component [Branchiibius hedensis]
MKPGSVSRRVLAAVALPIVLIALWWVLTANSTSFFWPPLKDILQAFPDTWNADRWINDVVPSLTRLATGYAIAVVVGIALGAAIGLSRFVRAFTEPTLEFFRAIPPPVLIPVIALFTGYTGSVSKIVTIALGSLWPILLNTVEGVRGLDPVLIDTATSYRLGFWRRMTYVVLPGASPRILAGARQALSIGVILMVISELFGATRGLGAAIVQFQRSFAVPQMWTGIILLGVIGFVLSLVFRVVENRLLAWYFGQRNLERGA